MKKENKLATEQETKENKLVELKDEDLEQISAGSGKIDQEKLKIVIPKESTGSFHTTKDLT